MSAIPSMFEASLGPTTELSTSLELIRSPLHCGTLEARWWAVEIGVRGRVVDATVGGVERPASVEFDQPAYATRIPLHLRVRLGLLDRHSGSDRAYLIDATSTRAYLFASSITIYLVGPKKLVAYSQGGDKALGVERDVFARFSAGIWPCDTRHQTTGVPGSLVRGASCSIRAFIEANTLDLAVPIPEGARTLMIFDSSGSDAPWTWQLGDPAVEQRGRLSLAGGQTLEPALVPNFTHVAPATRFDRDREVLLVFGMDL